MGFCVFPDDIPSTIPVNEECVIQVNTSEAGQGNITCRIRSMTGSDVDIDIVDNGDGTVSLMYTPHVPGAYTLNIKFGGQPVPNGTFTQQVSGMTPAFPKIVTSPYVLKLGYIWLTSEVLKVQGVGHLQTSIIHF